MTGRDDAILLKIAVLAEDLRVSRDKLHREALAQVEAQLAVKQRSLDSAVGEAIEEGHTITAIARAYTPPGSTPNRNKIYEIKGRTGAVYASSNGDYPFEWVSRTSNGRTHYDVIGTLLDFGPENVSGTFRWKYIAGSLEPVIDAVRDPYPNTRYYKQMLDQWVSLNPYPGGETS